MERFGLLGAVALALLVVACAPNPSPSATQSSDAASMTVTGSGALGGPWWMGPGAVFAVQPPGWTLEHDWAPRAEDTQFAVELVAGSEGPMRVTGVRQGGKDWIEPGHYQFVVITTRTPDSPPSAPLSAWFGCSVVVSIPTGTHAVNVDVEFGSSCTIAVSVESATPASSPESGG